MPGSASVRPARLWWSALFALIVGGVSALAFQPFDWAPLMPVAFTLLCSLLARQGSLGGSLLLGWSFGLGQFVVGLNWIATAFTFQAAMPPWLGGIAVVLLSLYLAVYPALATGLAWRLGRDRPLALVLALAGGWIVGEWLRAGMFTGFSWNPVGVVLAGTPLLRGGGLIGTYGLSGLVLLMGGALWVGWRDARQAAWVLLPVAIFAAGSLTLPAAPPDTRKAIRIVQPNIGQEGRWREDAAETTIATELGLSGPPLARPRLLLWPESAVTEPLADQRRGAEPFVETLRRSVTRGLGPGDLLIAGSEGLVSTDGIRVSSAVNSSFLLAPGGQVVGRYDKAHLVPYGEYLPMRPLLSAIGLSRLAPGDIDFDSGPGPRTFVLPGFGKAGLQICYEIIFSGEVVDRRNRPDFIFNPSNDSWFGRWGPPQHLAQARLRAAEEGLPVLRATPTGISAVVDADGRLRQSLPWRRAGVIDAALPAPRPPTPFARAGNWLPMLFALALFGGALAARQRRA